MKRGTEITPEFVEFIPPDLQDGVIYVSMIYGTAAHKCCCGCGRKVVTPFSPTDWSLMFDGESISLHPSIGNWSLECRSHYWIRKNRVQWAPQWSQEKVDAGRAHDRSAKERYFGISESADEGATRNTSSGAGSGKAERGLWRKLKKWWS